MKTKNTNQPQNAPVNFLTQIQDTTTAKRPNASNEELEAMLFASQDEKMLGYLYDLLPEEERLHIQAQIERSSTEQAALASAKQRVALFDAWSDQDVPSPLFAKTLAHLGLDDALATAER